MSTNSLESGGVLGGSARPKLPARRTLENLDRSNARSRRWFIGAGLGTFAATIAAILEEKNGRPVTSWLEKNVMFDGGEGYTTVDEGTPKEPIELAEVDLGESLTCRGRIIFIAEKINGRNHYTPSVILTISGLPPHPNGVECKINLHCGSGYSPKVEGQQRTRIVKTSMAGFGGKVDPETRRTLLAKLGSHTVPDEEEAKRLDALVHGKLAGYENLAHKSPEELVKLYDAIIANAAHTPEEPEEKPLIASFER